ncbi:MAG: hypothetical protein ACYTEG_09990 [Planctomycetota bacterium]|jgi:hypothetical protein
MGNLFLHLLFGSIGVGFFIYGKKQRRLVPWLSGIGLCVLPYIVSNLYAAVLVGVVLAALPWLFRNR